MNSLIFLTLLLCTLCVLTSTSSVNVSAQSTLSESVAFTSCLNNPTLAITEIFGSGTANVIGQVSLNLTISYTSSEDITGGNYELTVTTGGMQEGNTGTLDEFLTLPINTGSGQQQLQYALDAGETDFSLKVQDQNNNQVLCVTFSWIQQQPTTRNVKHVNNKAKRIHHTAKPKHNGKKQLGHPLLKQKHIQQRTPHRRHSTIGKIASSSHARTTTTSPHHVAVAAAIKVGV